MDAAAGGRGCLRGEITRSGAGDRHGIKRAHRIAELGGTGANKNLWIESHEPLRWSRRARSPRDLPPLKAADSTPDASPTGLEPRLGLGAVLAISLGAMLGSGVFVLPGIAAATAGPDLWLAYLLAGIGVLPAALSKAELGTAMPVSGGSYVYVDRAFGPLASTIFGLGLWISLLLKSAFALVGFGAYLKVVTDAPVEPLSMALLAGIVALNILGVKKVGKAQKIVVGISIIGIVLLALAALVTGEWHPSDAPPASTTSLFATVGLIYISYAGVTKVAAVAEEVKNPSRNLPLGMLLSLGIATLLYSSVTYLMASKVPMAELAGDLHPVYLMAEYVTGPTVAIAVAILAIMTMVSMANAGLLASSRFPFAMARDGLLPSRLARVHERYLTPVTAIVATGALMAIAILFLDIKSLAKLASATMIAGFLAQNLAVIVLRESATQWYEPTWRSPLYPFVQLAGVVICLGLLFMLGWTGAGALVATAAIGTTVFFWIGRSANRQGVLDRLGPRRELLTTTPDPTSLEEVNELPSRAQVVVPILGREPSTETLAEMGAALSSSGITEVVRLIEVPDQISAEAFDLCDPHVLSLRRRINGLASERELSMEFDAFAVHDAIRVVHEISKRVACEWVVLEWAGRSRGSLLLFNPLGWLVGHLGCNLALFKDAGIRTFRRILVLCEPGPHDSLIAGTADHLARVFGAELVFARFVDDDAPAVITQGETDYLDELATLCSVPPETLVVRGKDEARSIAALTPAHDLLLVGAPPQAGLKNFIREHWVDRLTRLATCSVLRLKAAHDAAHLAPKRTQQKQAEAPLALSSFVAPTLLASGVEANTKDELFALFAAALVQTINATEDLTKTIEAALWTRERTQNTAVGQGLALPHATVSEIDRTYLGIFTAAVPVDYKTPDAAPVDTFFVTIGPPSERGTHLQILAGMSRLVLGTGLLEDLRSATTSEELMTALRCAEAAVSKG